MALEVCESKGYQRCDCTELQLTMVFKGSLRKLSHIKKTSSLARRFDTTPLRIGQPDNPEIPISSRLQDIGGHDLASQPIIDSFQVNLFDSIGT
ncbi:hypothetical protein GOBAR_AA25874 [Gossypium barbadense]|uniref:Uncharacterized protein n=1 Tax=Gossypium barbadense TaxID=3634 RepID=A0A2P5WUL1_GOSBA|nr:hypothetical protein GOBAR_AA25874 [Gossypium barbadense]